MKRSGLVDPFPTPETAASALIGVQAQIEPAAGLALWNRTSGLTMSKFTDLLYKDKTLVKLWGQRGTLHLYASSDWPLIHAMRSINKTWWERQIAAGQLVSNDHAALVERIATLLLERETMGRTALRQLLEQHNIELAEDFYSPWGGIFADLVRMGYACHAGRIKGEGHFAHRHNWLPKLAWNPPDADVANVQIMRRYFQAYGPATLADFTYWRYPSSGHQRRWFETIQPELVEVNVAGQPMWVLDCDLDELIATPPAPEAWPIKMLFRFEPYLLAHKEKDWVADAAHYKAIWRPAGHIEGIVLVYGRAVATWGYEKKAGGLRVFVQPFAHLASPVLQTIHKITPEIAAFFETRLFDLTISLFER
ncbi:MAG: winged helix DNA-binding domain-containing protein [Caldilineaceae bacterium]